MEGDNLNNLFVHTDRLLTFHLIPNDLSQPPYQLKLKL
jgi:hypothetical protein